MANTWLKHQNQIREVDSWDRAHLWDIKFEGAPNPFNDWFPAGSVSITFAAGSTYKYDATYRDYSLPSSSGEGELKLLDIPDTESGALYNWFDNWYSEIYHSGKGVKSLKNSVKICHIAKLNSQRDIVKVMSFWVYPTGGMSWERDSSSSIVKLNYDFIIAGIVK